MLASFTHKKQRRSQLKDLNCKDSKDRYYQMRDFLPLVVNGELTIWYDMISLFNFGIKTVVHMIIKHD